MLGKILNYFGYPTKIHSTKIKIEPFSIKELGINKKHFSSAAIETTKKLQKNGFNAFIVGGAVRDLILGLKPKDFDVVTNAKPEQIKKIFRRSRIIGRRFKLVHVYIKDETIEVSTFRSKNSTNVTFDSQGRITRDNSFGEQDDDANRRDLSINSLYLDPLNDKVFDYHNGVSDINHRIIKMIGIASERYREDPVRMIRVLRFSAKLNFAIENKTYNDIKKHSNLISGVPKSRLVDEIIKLLLSGNAMKGIRELWETKLYVEAMPLLKDAFSNQTLKSSNLTVNEFLEVAFSLVDKRVSMQKPISLGFVFACLLWHRLLKAWSVNKSRGYREVPALHDAINKIIEDSFKSFPVQKRHLSDMKEIWILQPRFEKRRGKAPYRLIKNLKFRVALNFLKLRAEIKMADSDLPSWWEEFSTQKEEERINLINSLSYPTPGLNPKKRNKSVGVHIT